MCAWISSFSSRIRRPSSLRASRSASSLAWPIDLLTNIGLPRKLLDLGLQLPPLRLELDEPRDIGLHAAAVAVFLNQFGVFENESLVEHGNVYPCG